jgi:flagellar assembly protein FliH
MDGPALEGEETREVRYETYRPRAFDEGEASSGAARGATTLPARAGEFQRHFTPGQDQASPFEEGAHEAGGPETDFAALKFQRENTLLTNAESYAASIREEAQLYVRQLRSEVESLNAEAEKRYEEAEQARQAAVAEAERAVAEANEQVEEIRAQARQEGFQAGQEEGQARRYAEAAGHLEQLEAILKEMEQYRKRLAFYTEKDGVRLAILIAKKLLHSELKINRKAVLRLVAGTLSKLEGKGTFRVWVSPDDQEFMLGAKPSLERFMDAEQTLTVRSRPDLQPGNVLIESDREMIDLTLESQFYHLEKLLNQTLAERETVLTHPTAPARPAGGAPPKAGKAAPAGSGAGRQPPAKAPPHGG